MDYRHGSHTKFAIHLHLVWVTKYRKQVLKGEIAWFVREVIREECRRLKVDILKGYVSTDHVHLFVSIPPQVTISRLVQPLKGKSSFQLLARYPELSKIFWGRPFWARGYLVHRRGQVTDEIIRVYLENQQHDDNDFQIACECLSLLDRQTSA